MIQAGHVGISFNKGRTIFGFFPSDRAMNAAESVAEGYTEKILKRGDVMAGQVRDDTWVFKRAFALAELTGWTTDVRQLSVVVSRGQFLQARRDVLHDLQEGSSLSKLYRFPLRDANKNPLPMPCGYDNCATYARTVGIPIPEDTGQLSLYMKKLTEAFMDPWH